MQIILSKFADKPSTLSCIRDDGSVTWQSYGNQSAFFAIHDLTHFAVETVLDYRHAFYGMIAAGREVSDFGPGDAANFSPEAVYGELLAGLLTTAEGYGSKLTYNEIKAAIDQRAAEAQLPPIALTEDQLATIRQRAAELAEEWKRLPTGKKLTLTFG